MLLPDRGTWAWTNYYTRPEWLGVEVKLLYCTRNTVLLLHCDKYYPCYQHACKISCKPVNIFNISRYHKQETRTMENKRKTFINYALRTRVEMLMPVKQNKRNSNKNSHPQARNQNDHAWCCKQKNQKQCKKNLCLLKWCEFWNQ